MARSEQQQLSTPEPQAADSPIPSSLHPLTPPHPYCAYSYILTDEWMAKIAKEHGICGPDWDSSEIEPAVLGFLNPRLPRFQIHFVDDLSIPYWGYSI
ncbi:hypothetical protein JVT61DRAFT_3694 [Boletus reticuloceps]|uniref:Uncharacterized protein n=1 Tax=Boletus reticuloceps TaxID=495285 RepID=A0A8I2YNW3_9AGAM|nr:hypothetical protein JVT61DRAFT_3694 [Boletus reticuloceps]